MSNFKNSFEERAQGTQGGELIVAEWESTDAGGTSEPVFEMPDGEGCLAVMIEGDLSGAKIQIPTLDGTAWDVLAPDSAEGKFVLYTTSTRQTGTFKRLSLFVGAKVNTRIKVTFAYLSKVMKKGWGKLSCKMCKKLVALLIKALLASFHLPLPSFSDHSDLPKSVWESLEKFIHEGWDHLPSGVHDLFSGLDSNFLQKFISAFKWTVDSIWAIASSIDKILESICQKLGFCPISNSA